MLAFIEVTGKAISPARRYSGFDTVSVTVTMVSSEYTLQKRPEFTYEKLFLPLKNKSQNK